MRAHTHNIATGVTPGVMRDACRDAVRRASIKTIRFHVHLRAGVHVQHHLHG